ALAVTGFPGHRRFTAKSLQQAVEEAGLRVTRTETLPGPIPVGYVEGTSCRADDAARDRRRLALESGRAVHRERPGDQQARRPPRPRRRPNLARPALQA